MPQDLDEVDEPDELVDDELDVDVDVDDDLDVDEDGDVDLDDSSDLLVDGEDAEEDVASTPATAKPDEEEEEDDVEASLDVILKERLVVEEVDEDDEELAEPDERADGVERVLPKQPDEFVCRSCFLVKHPSQLADGTRMLCRDCV